MGKEFTLREKGDGVVITEYHGLGGEIEIPDVIDGKQVIAILEGAFYACTSLTSVTIPTNVDLIGDGAFSHCSSLTSVTILGDVTRIGHFAFAFCTSLTSIVFLEELPPLVGENWILGTSSGIKGHAYATSHFPDPGGEFFDLKMGDAIPPIVQPQSRRATVFSSDSPDQVNKKMIDSPDQVTIKKAIRVKHVSIAQKQETNPAPCQHRDDMPPLLPKQKTRCSFCGAETYGSRNCEFCGGKL